MKVLIIGGTGMLGHKLIQVLMKEFDVFSIIRSGFSNIEKYGLIDSERVFDNISVENFESVETVLKNIKPDFVINAVGVIKQIPTSKDVLTTLNINSIFPQRLARVAQKYDFRLINISTDCVFSGKKGNYIEEDISDAEDLYGKSKFLGEVYGKNCLTLRTSIIGRELSTEHSLIEWFLSNAGGKIKGYKNAVYSGFPTIVLAELMADLMKNYPDLEGLFHVSSEPINKYELLCLVKEKFGLDIEITPFEDFYIDRSLDSAKFRKLTGFKPNTWEEMISRMADDPTPYDKWRNQTF
jgi:dTDP-4-dehydrorhamnose reductase